MLLCTYKFYPRRNKIASLYRALVRCIPLQQKDVLSSKAVYFRKLYIQITSKLLSFGNRCSCEFYRKVIALIILIEEQ
jgi:hypothetical protein